jgi:hypothetical protein
MVTKVFVRFDKLIGRSPKGAYLLKIDGTEMWFPFQCCYNFILNSKLGGNMVIPVWLYKEKFGCEPPDEDAAVTIERHVPERKEPVKTEPHADLTK